jgi:hypothetical protein
MNLFYKKVLKGALLEQQLAEIFSVIQLGHHFIGNVQQDFRSKALIFLIRWEADFIFKHRCMNSRHLWEGGFVPGSAV